MLYLEAESAYMANMQGLSQLNCRSVSNFSNEETWKHEDCIKLDKDPDRIESLIGGISNINAFFWFLLASASSIGHLTSYLL